MDAKTLNEIMHSDMKLWDAAEEEDGEKFLVLPHGIGRVGVSLEGLTDAKLRAAAVGSFGEYIRGAVKDAIGDEAVTARAKQALAKVSEDSGEFFVDESDDSDTRGLDEKRSPFQEIPNQQTVQASNVLTSGPEAVALRGSELRERVKNMEARLEDYRAELKGIEAYLEVFNASAHKKAPDPDKEPALEGSDEGK